MHFCVWIYTDSAMYAMKLRKPSKNSKHFQVNVTVAIANWEGIGRKASARDNRKGLK
jgi:hypothetical protein